MPDKEETIKGLLDIRADYEDQRCAASVQLIDDTIALLNRQEEPVKPHLNRGWYACDCGADITVVVDGKPLGKANYCSKCGRRLIWE